MHILAELDEQVTTNLQRLTGTFELNVTALKSGLDHVERTVKDIVTNVSSML